MGAFLFYLGYAFGVASVIVLLALYIMACEEQIKKMCKPLHNYLFLGGDEDESSNRD